VHGVDGAGAVLALLWGADDEVVDAVGVDVPGRRDGGAGGALAVFAPEADGAVPLDSSISVSAWVSPSVSSRLSPEAESVCPAGLSWQPCIHRRGRRGRNRSVD